MIHTFFYFDKLYQIIQFLRFLKVNNGYSWTIKSTMSIFKNIKSKNKLSNVTENYVIFNSPKPNFFREDPIDKEIEEYWNKYVINNEQKNEILEGYSQDGYFINMHNYSPTNYNRMEITYDDKNNDTICHIHFYNDKNDKNDKNNVNDVNVNKIRELMYKNKIGEDIFTELDDVFDESIKEQDEKNSDKKSDKNNQDFRNILSMNNYKNKTKNEIYDSFIFMNKLALENNKIVVNDYRRVNDFSLLLTQLKKLNITDFQTIIIPISLWKRCMLDELFPDWSIELIPYLVSKFQNDRKNINRKNNISIFRFPFKNEFDIYKTIQKSNKNIINIDGNIFFKDFNYSLVDYKNPISNYNFDTIYNTELELINLKEWNLAYDIIKINYGFIIKDEADYENFKYLNELNYSYPPYSQFFCYNGAYYEELLKYKNDNIWIYDELNTSYFFADTIFLKKMSDVISTKMIEFQDKRQVKK